MLEMLFVIYFLKPRLLQREKELKSALSRIHGLPDIRYFTLPLRLRISGLSDPHYLISHHVFLSSVDFYLLSRL